MKKSIYSVLLLLPLLFLSCSKENITTPIETQNSSKGKVLLKLDKANAPSAVSSVVAILSRAGYDTLSQSMNLKSDSTADLCFSNIAIGTWKLKINAKSSLGTILYTGQSDVVVSEATTTQVNLTLEPTGLGVGNISISVVWGTTVKNWIDNPANPIFTIQNSPASPYLVSLGKVIYENGKYKMWYQNTYESARMDVSYAESSDGIHWTNITNSPVFKGDPLSTWDSYSVMSGPVIKEDGLYKMYYCGFSNESGPWNIGLAESQDGINWTRRASPVLSASTAEGRIGAGSVIKKDGLYYMFYNYSNYSDNRAICVATSYNGIQWTKYENNPIIVPTQPWEGSSVYAPTVILEDNQFKMIYMNYEGTGFGMATSTDGFHWTKSSSQPIFKPENTYNKWTTKIAYPYLMKLSNQYRLYYTGSYNGGLAIALATKAL